MTTDFNNCRAIKFGGELSYSQSTKESHLSPPELILFLKLKDKRDFSEVKK